MVPSPPSSCTRLGQFAAFSYRYLFYLLQYINTLIILLIQVWRGLTGDGEQIAVKQIVLDVTDREKAEREYQKVQEEVEILKTLQHKNIVRWETWRVIYCIILHKIKIIWSELHKHFSLPPGIITLDHCADTVIL